ncbi:beta-1,3-galactosyltransferase 5-like isoform X2 [Argopecten irradians]
MEKVKDERRRKGCLVMDVCCLDRISVMYSPRINGWKTLKLVLLTLIIPGNIFLLYYFQFAVKAVDLLRTLPVCDSCQSDISVQNLSRIDNCILNHTSSTMSPELLIFVLNKYNDYTSRQIIRQTWGSTQEQLSGNFRVVFVVGKGQTSKLSLESSTHGDILQVDVLEAYRKLTDKVTRAILWYKERCSNIKYIFKTDADMFLNVPFILNIARNYNLKNKLVGGCFQSYEAPDRRNNSKWRVSEKEFSGSRYPPYCSGTGYLMDKATATKLSGAFKDTPMFPMEDVYMGFCAYKTNVEVMAFTGFHITSFNYDEFMYCHCVASVHRPVKLRSLWRRHEAFCHSRWRHWSGYPITCFFMTSNYVLHTVLAMLATLLISATIVVVLCRRRLKSKKLVNSST